MIQGYEVCFRKFFPFLRQALGNPTLFGHRPVIGVVSLIWGGAHSGDIMAAICMLSLYESLCRKGANSVESNGPLWLWTVLQLILWGYLGLAVCSFSWALVSVIFSDPRAFT
ncbi:MAG: hypothetical protein CR994_06875 [Maribacter sp.]|nr:MAG: hypothetical protein CR994_06875 [Maribacter sp.]